MFHDQRDDNAGPAGQTQGPENDSLRVAVTGSSGLVGLALAPLLTTGGHEVIRLVRRRPDAPAGEIAWDPEAGSIEADRLEGLDAVVHLAGKSVAAARWTDAVKAGIRDSRVVGTRFLCETLASLREQPKVLITASGINYYGDRGEEELDEDAESGEGFLADVCRRWEAATEPAKAAGIRVVRLRFGVILSPHGGALAKMLIPFRLGAGGPFGSGKQYWSWISIDDAVGVIRHAIRTESLQGPVNAVAPGAVTNRQFTRTLARVLRRPAFLAVPSRAARLALGEMAEEMLLASIRVAPRRLIASGYAFRHPELEPALRHVLGKS